MAILIDNDRWLEYQVLYLTISKVLYKVLHVPYLNHRQTIKIHIKFVVTDLTYSLQSDA